MKNFTSKNKKKDIVLQVISYMLGADINSSIADGE